MAQWMHIYETTDETLNLVFRTFLSVFPYMSIWQPALGDFVLIGGVQPLQVSLPDTIARYSEAPVAADLARVGLLTLPTVLSREIVPQQNGLFIVPPEGPLHSDFYPALEYVAHRAFFLNRMAERWRQFREDFTPRATTHFGRYLQQHSLTHDDFVAFVRDYDEHRMPDPPLFRSLLLRWQDHTNRPVFPVDLWMAAADRTPAAELRVLRLSPLRDAMVQDAATNPAPLRFYAADLMEAYRSQRSIFYLPPATNLTSVLERLIETDPGQQRVYKLNLAELAWDRGDDARCLELAQAALDPDVTKGGPIDFSRDPVAPRAVLYRAVETLFRSGKPDQAWVVCQEARSGGFLVNADTLFPLLNVTYRRVEAAVGQKPDFTQPGP